ATGDEERRLSSDEHATARGLHDAEAALAAARSALETASVRTEELRAAESKARLLAADAAERARHADAERRTMERTAEELGARGVLTAGRAGLNAAEQAALERQLTAAGLPCDAATGWGNGLAHVDAAGDAADALRGALSTVLVLRDLDAAWRAHAILARLQDA